MSPRPPIPTGTVTFLFTDLEGSTKLWERFPVEMQGALARHDEIVRSSIAGHGGYVFATGGDGFAAAFTGAVDAVDAAVTAQRGLSEESWPEGMALSVRMGVHAGEAHERDGDYFGPTLNRIGRLHAVAHGGQIVVSAATEPLLREHVELRDLGQHRLRDLDETASIFQVMAGGLSEDFPRLRTLESAAHNLPTAVDHFVGRDQEIRDLVAALRASRLVTLTGVGGTGKTRLALEAATHELGRFTDGVWLVELAALTEGSATPFVVGDVVGAVQQDGLSMIESLVRSLSSRNVLLVLDNCEHLLDEIADLVGTLIARCPQLVVLATSREGLAVRGERILAIPSLTADEGAALFSARAVAAGADVGESDAGGIAEIVGRLDGLPLAIELAAARTSALTVAEVAERLDDRFRLLRGAGRGRLERHQTLWNTVAWSYDLLDLEEQAIFDQLSVFDGGFTLDAAQGVCGPRFDALDIEDAVIALVERSMVTAEQTRSGTRYKLLETLRQFGEARLGEEDIDEVRRRHGDWYAAFAERAYEGLGTEDGIDWNHRQLAEIDNFRTVVYGSNRDAACRVVAAMGVLWWMRLDYEYVDWALQTLRSPVEDERAWKLGLAQGLVAAQNAGRHEDANRIRSAIDPAEELTGAAKTWFLVWAMQDAVLAGQLEGAFDMPRRSLENALTLEDEFDRLVFTQFASTMAVILGDLDTAKEIWKDHVDVAARNSAPALEAAGRFHHGRYLATVDQPGAGGEFERSADLSRQLKWPLLEHVALSELAAELAAEGEYSLARPRLADAIRTWTSAGDLLQLWVTLHHVADLLAKEGDVRRAQEVWAQLRDRSGPASPEQRSALQAQFGEPPETTMTDDEMLGWSRDLADYLAT